VGEDERTNKRDKFRERYRTLEEYYQRELHSFQSTLMTLSTGAVGVLMVAFPAVFPIGQLTPLSKFLFVLCLLIFGLSTVLFALVKNLDHKQAFRKIEWETAKYERDAAKEHGSEEEFKARDKEEARLAKEFDRNDRLSALGNDVALWSFVLAVVFVVVLVAHQIVVDP
jgi:hypothetical protein